MKICIVISHADYAGLTILEHLKKYDLEKFNAFIYETKEKSIYCEDLDKKVKADLFIFATTHRSEKGVNSLTTHFPGNFTTADLGGKPKTLNVSASRFLREFYLELKRLNNLDYEVALEADHHGPYLEKPSIFIEIGSSEKQWKDSKAGGIIAQTIVNVLSQGTKKRETVLILGGGHYNQVAMKVLEKTDYHIAHICAKHSLGGFNENTLHQALTKSMDPVSLVIVDEKGLGQYKSNVLQILERSKVAWKKYKQLP